MMMNADGNQCRRPPHIVMIEAKKQKNPFIDTTITCRRPTSSIYDHKIKI